jgi:hypothetical protein
MPDPPDPVIAKYWKEPLPPWEPPPRGPYAELYGIPIREDPAVLPGTVTLVRTEGR